MTCGPILLSNCKVVLWFFDARAGTKAWTEQRAAVTMSQIKPSRLAGYLHTKSLAVAFHRWDLAYLSGYPLNPSTDHCGWLIESHLDAPGPPCDNLATRTSFRVEIEPVGSNIATELIDAHGPPEVQAHTPLYY